MGADPISLMLMASAAVSATGNILGGFSEANTANAQSQIARNNSLIAQQNARYAMASGEQNAANEGLKTRADVGSLKAGQAAGGIDVNTGSAVDVRESKSETGLLDALTIRSNAARQAYGQDLEAQQYTAQSKLYRNQAKAAPYLGFLKAGGSLLSGAAAAKTYGGGGSGSSGGSTPYSGVVSDFGDTGAVWSGDVG